MDNPRICYVDYVHGERYPKLEKIAVVAVVGNREVETQTLSVRTRRSGDLGVLTFSEVVNRLQEAIANKTVI